MMIIIIIKTLSTLLCYAYSVRSAIEPTTTKRFTYVIRFATTGIYAYNNYTSPDKRPQIHAYIIISEPEMDAVSFTDKRKKIKAELKTRAESRFESK